MKVTEYQHGVPCWVDLAAPDIEAAKSFYSSLFGWRPDVAEEPAAGGYVMFTLNDEGVAGAATPMQPAQPTVWTTYISVEDADKVAEAVVENGGTVMMPPMDVLDVGRMAIFADPAGAAFAVWQPGTHKGAGLVNEPGALCWNELLTRDPAGARAFYSAVFGWGAKTSPFGDGEYTEWQVGDRTVGGMMPMTDQFPPQVPPHWMVYFAVADCDSSAAKVTELGGMVAVPPTTIPVGRFAACADPQGAAFSIIALAEEPQGQGS